MSIVKGYTEFTLDEKQIAATEASTEELHKFKRQGLEGSFEVCLPKPTLWGRMWGSVFEEGCPPTNIIRADKRWGVELHWCIYGSLVQFMCGSWCVRLHCESMGPGEEFDFPQDSKERCAKLIKMDPCKSCYEDYIYVPAGFVKTEWCGTPYKVVATVQYLTACKDRPGPVTGFIEFPIIEFYQTETTG
jgi:hypothetical protein